MIERKIPASHLEEEINIEFGIFSPKKRPCHIKSPSNTFTVLAVAEVIFFVSKSHRKKLIKNIEDAEDFFDFHRKFEVDANENETSSEPGSFCI